MARPLKKRKLPAPKKAVPKKLQSVTPLIYYGGKTRDVQWIIGEFPPHDCFVDVFGGGGAVTFAKIPSRCDVYNDLGNVSAFMRVLRDYPDELYNMLYYSNFSRQLFYDCSKRWQEISEYYRGVVLTSKKPFREVFEMEAEMAIEWAFCWYITILQGHTHSEKDASWKVSRGNDTAMSVNNKVDELYRFSARLREVIVEDRDFAEVIKLYDSPTTLFYCDPPYTAGSRATYGEYTHEMPAERHRELLSMLCSIKGQAIVSMYSDPLYEQLLSDWRRKEVTHLSSIQNLKSMQDGRDKRTEILWIKEHVHGLWSLLPTDIPTVSGSVEDSTGFVFDGEGR